MELFQTKFIKEFLKIDLQSYLKSRRFKRSGNYHFINEENDVIKILSIISNPITAKEMGDVGEFSVDLGIHFNGVEKLMLNGYPVPKVGPACFVNFRLWSFNEEKKIVWPDFTFNSNTDIKQFSDKFLETYKSVGEKWFNECCNPKNAIKYLINEEVEERGNYYFKIAVLYILSGEQISARNYLNKEIERVNEQIESTKINYPNSKNIYYLTDWKNMVIAFANKHKFLSN